MQEYYIFDPLGDYLEPRLRGYQLIDGELLPLPGPRFFSRLLNVELLVVEDALRLYDIANGMLRSTPAEERDARQREAEARRMAEVEIERLRAERP